MALSRRNVIIAAIAAFTFLGFFQGQAVAQQNFITVASTTSTEHPSSVDQSQATSTPGEPPSTGQPSATDPTGAAQQPSSEGQQQEPPPTETEGASFQGISQRLDDDTIDFITRLPFP